MSENNKNKPPTKSFDEVCPQEPGTAEGALEAFRVIAENLPESVLKDFSLTRIPPQA